MPLGPTQAQLMRDTSVVAAVPVTGRTGRQRPSARYLATQVRGNWPKKERPTRAEITSATRR